MKIWIDMLTPKQVLFFEPVIKALKERGDEIVVTSRHYREAELMLRKRQINAVFIAAIKSMQAQNATKAFISLIDEYFSSKIYI